MHGGQEVIDDWLARTDSDHHSVVYDALFAIMEGTWYQLYEHWNDLTHPCAVAMRLNDEEVLIWRTYIDIPGVFRVLYVGRVDY